MSSSILEAALLNQESHPIENKHSISGIAAKLKIPKRAWSGYHLFHLAKNIKSSDILDASKLPRIRPKNKESEEDDDDEDDEEPVEMEQLITLMQNHKVSEHTSKFNFNFGADNNSSSSQGSNKMSTTTPVTATNNTTWVPSPEFKFSFSTSIPPKAHSYAQANTYNEDHDPRLQKQQSAKHNQHLAHRRILPLPKPRWKKSTAEASDDSKAKSAPKMFNIPAAVTADTPPDRDHTKKLKSSSNNNKDISHPVAVNKRKERNWKDSSGTTADVPENFFSLDKNTGIKYTQSTPLSFKATLTAVLPPPPPPPLSLPLPLPLPIPASPLLPPPSPALSQPLPPFETAKKPITSKKKGKAPLSSASSSYTKPTNLPNTKKKKNKKKSNSNKQDIAPGGFLSSDVTLFDNPISDDWICLFCQYDILMYGMESAKRKNGFYKRQRERNRRIKEAELRRLGGLSESEEEHDYNYHHHHQEQCNESHS